jgi:poly(hydroxyalkanoate) depolymerase family esterase
MMRRLSDTLSRLAAFRAAHTNFASGDPGRLSSLKDFGSNPGELNGWTYLPRGLQAGAPLVVILHGCTQTAAGYDHGAGWSALADRYGFALLFPEQTRGNNANLCFNWFQLDDTRRGSGEALSIAQMIETVAREHAIDRSRVFITGLSAGGAMTAAMLAAYPALFAGGAIIAGLPSGVAASVPEAFDRMRGHGLPDARELQRLLRQASDHPGPWPSLSLWHGGADATVAIANMDAIIDQWRAVHGIEERDGSRQFVDGHVRQAWRDKTGREVIEAYTIAGMAHGTPLAAADGGYGASGPFMLEAGISSTLRIAQFWGIAGQEAETRATAAATNAARRSAGSPELTPPSPWAEAARRKHRPREGVSPAGSASGNVGRVIEDALRKAGLLR